MDDWPTYGRAVRERREALGLTQGAGGISPASWRNVDAVLGDADDDDKETGT